jgi:fused signal recognition particle receptor
MAFNLFKKLKDGLERTRKQFTEGVRQVLANFRPIDESLFEDLEEVLIGADVGIDTTEKILDRVRQRVKYENVKDSSGVEALLRDEIAGVLEQRGKNGAGASAGGTAASATATAPAPPAITTPTTRPHVIIIIGVNGVGKTTTIGKLAHRYTSEGRKVLIAASDTFRAAAVEQLAIWADRANVDIIRSASGADPASVAFDGLEAALARGSDVLIVDTAGRLQTKINLMEELKKIGRVLSRKLPGAPHEVLLVLDATTGQNAVIQAREFGIAMGLTGLVLAKVDGTAKGGVVIAIADQLGVPVRYLGMGEGIDDLAPFDPRQFAAALFDSTSSSGSGPDA